MILCLLRVFCVYCEDMYNIIGDNVLIVKRRNAGKDSGRHVGCDN